MVLSTEFIQSLFRRTTHGLKILSTGSFLMHLLVLIIPLKISSKIGWRFWMDVSREFFFILIVVIVVDCFAHYPTTWIFLLLLVVKHGVQKSSIIYPIEEDRNNETWIDIVLTMLLCNNCCKAPIKSVLLPLFIRWKSFVLCFNLCLFPDYDWVFFHHKYYFLKFSELDFFLPPFWGYFHLFS